jgi:hypothetical protein
MINLVDCPACEGRGSFCLRVNDGTWSDLLLMDVACDFCNGKRRVPLMEAMEYSMLDAVPCYPYSEAEPA